MHHNLSSKVWYRLLQVLFVLSFIIVQLIGAVVVYDAMEGSAEMLRCDNGTEHITSSLFSDPFEGLALCSNSDTIKQVYENYQLGRNVEASRKYLADLQKNYTVYDKPFYSTGAKVAWHIGVFVAVSLLFIVVRKVFLYIILGKQSHSPQ